MGYIKIHQEKLNSQVIEELLDICPFNAFDYQDAYLSVNAACKMCKLCIKKGPEGVCEFIDEPQVQIDKQTYKGIVVYLEQRHNKAHPVGYELIGKAQELARKTKEPVYALVIGNDVAVIAQEALEYGVDKVFMYEDNSYKYFNVERYTEVIEQFYRDNHINIILFGGTSEGRSFAPRVAARLKTGLTADCTMLDITKEGDLLQIRPAFGGNIMAKINTPNHRPQLATIRYKMFDAPVKTVPHGTIVRCDTKTLAKESTIELIHSTNKEQHQDISDADIIIAVGRAFKKEKDLELIEPLRQKLQAEVACTRPLIENGWFDPRKQIGLSGRTVKPKLIINLGISGAVQYIEGMKDAELIISVNKDPNNRLFEISHYAIQGDIYDVLPELNNLLSDIL